MCERLDSVVEVRVLGMRKALLVLRLIDELASRASRRLTRIRISAFALDGRQAEVIAPQQTVVTSKRRLRWWCPPVLSKLDSACLPVGDSNQGRFDASYKTYLTICPYYLRLRLMARCLPRACPEVRYGIASS